MEEPQDHTCVWSLGGEDPPEKKTETHSCILAWEVQCTEESSGLQGMGSQESWTQLSNWAKLLSGKITNGWHIQFSSVQSLSCVWLFATPWTAACQASLSIPTPRVHPNPCPSSLWYHPTTSSSVVPLSSCPQSFPASGSFQMSQLFASGGQTNRF